MVAALVPFKFQATSETEYKLELEYEFDAKVFNMLFDKTKTQLKKKRGLEVTGEAGEIEEFSLPKDKIFVFRPVLWKAARSNFYNVKKQIKADGIKILNAEVSDAIFKKTPDDKYKVKIIITGDYVNEHNQ